MHERTRRIKHEELMRICRFSTDSRSDKRYAIIDGEILIVLDAEPFKGIKPGKGRVPLEEARLHAPVQPGKVVCVGLNDRLHAEEMEKTLPREPRIFIKPSTTVIGPDEPIVLPAFSSLVEHESELGVVIGKKCHHLHPEQVWNHVLGYTCVNDVTARDLQRRDGHYTRAKGFDSFCPVGPWVETGLHPKNLGVRCRVNGELRQDGHSRNMIHSIEKIIAYISSIMTLLPGDIVSTGTYAGTGPLNNGDEVEVEVEGIGTLRNPVIASPTTGVYKHSKGQ